MIYNTYFQLDNKLYPYGAEFEKNSAPSLFALKSARVALRGGNAVFRKLFVDFRQ